jgi:hypothetical protein
MVDITNAILKEACEGKESTTLNLVMKKETFNKTIEELLAKGYAISYRELGPNQYSVVIYWGSYLWGDRYK